MTYQPVKDIPQTVMATQKQQKKNDDKRSKKSAVKSLWRFYKINCQLKQFLICSNLKYWDL